MHVIVHRIRLHEGVEPSRFEQWVRDTDYAAAPELPSVRSFAVHRVTSDPTAPFQFFEIITVNSIEGFERDVQSKRFRLLEEDFGRMASVVDEISGGLIEPGYSAV